MSIVTSSNSHERTLLVAVGVCLVDVLLTGGAALASTSLTILSDAFKEGTDFLAVLAAYLTLRAVRRSPDERYAYGIGKLENLVSMAIAVMMVACACFILVQASHHLRNPQQVEGTLPGIVIFSTYAVIGFGIFFRNRLELRKRESAILASQGQLWFSKAVFDTLMAATLIAEIVLREYSWSQYLDPLASLVGVCFLLHAAWSIASSSVGDLLDASLTEHLQLRILRQLVEHVFKIIALLGGDARAAGDAEVDGFFEGVNFFARINPAPAAALESARVGKLGQLVGRQAFAG
jgi:cation diffusion facilitator family transporter